MNKNSQITHLEVLHKRIADMAAGARVVLGLDARPGFDPDAKKSSPYFNLRQAAYYFDMTFPFPDGTGQAVKEEWVAFLKTLSPHPTFKGNFFLEVDGVHIRFEITNSIYYNQKRIWINSDEIMEGVYEDTKGIRVQAWGLDYEDARFRIMAAGSSDG